MYIFLKYLDVPFIPLNPGAIAGDLTTQRTNLQVQTTQYLIKYNENRSQVVDFIENMIKFSKVQEKYFQDGLKLVQEWSECLGDMNNHLESAKKDYLEEKMNLEELKNMLKPTKYNHDREGALISSGTEKEGMLFKKSRYLSGLF